MWLSNESINKLLQLDNEAPSKEELQESFKSQIESGAIRECPVCVAEKMNLIIVHGVEIDLCPKCNGLFFDEGELVKVLPSASQMNNGPGVGGYVAAEGLFWLLSAILGGIR